MTHDEMLIAVVYEAYDKHCHACSMFVATHALHIKTLQGMKHYREATILQVIGLSWEAWKRPGQTSSDRTEDRGAWLFEGVSSSSLRAQHSLRIGAHETTPRRFPNEAVAGPLLQRGGSGARD